jgi:hypothetical protein
MDIYFNENGGGSNPWVYTTGVSSGTYYTINSQIFYKMPYNGSISGVSVNNLRWFTSSARLDIIRWNSSTSELTSLNPTFGAAGSSFPATFPISGYTTSFGSTSFSAGDGLACVIRATGAWTLPFAPISGIVSVTVYVIFT